MKNILYKMIQYLPKLYDCFGGNVNIELGLSSYAKKKADLKGATGADTVAKYDFSFHKY